MELKILEQELTICKVPDLSAFDLTGALYFIGKTDEELSLVCPAEDAPPNAAARDDGWRDFRIQGVLDFSLTGVLSELSSLPAAGGIGIFAVSTYNTDYILVKKENLSRARKLLTDAGHTVTGAGPARLPPDGPLLPCTHRPEFLNFFGFSPIFSGIGRSHMVYCTL